MRTLQVSTRAEWRTWLSRNHSKVEPGIWLIFFRKNSGRASLEYEESVEEALCFGWIDSLIKRIDSDTYCRKFTPRKDTSAWSQLNRKRAEKVIREGRMTRFGLMKIQAAQKSGNWDAKPRSPVSADTLPELLAGLTQNTKAKAFFDQLSPSAKRQFTGWIAAAKRTETRARRIKETLALLAKGQRLGLK